MAGVIARELLDRAATAYDDYASFRLATEPLQFELWADSHGFSPAEVEQLRGLQHRVLRNYAWGVVDYDEIVWTPGEGEKRVRAYRAA